MVSVVVLANSFYIRIYKGLYKPMCLHPIYWTFAVKGLMAIMAYMYFENLSANEFCSHSVEALIQHCNK